jgi:hypothetical protein
VPRNIKHQTLIKPEVPNSVPAAEGKGAFFEVEAAARAHAGVVPRLDVMEGSDRALGFEVEPSKSPNFRVRQTVEDRFKNRRATTQMNMFQMVRTWRAVGVETEPQSGRQRDAHSDDGIVELFTFPAGDGLDEEIMPAVGTT